MADGLWRRITETRLADGSLLAFSVDVTEEVRKAEALEQALAAAKLARERLDDAVEALPAGFELWDADDHLVLTNSELSRLYPDVAHLFRPGTAWEEIVRANHALGALAVPAEGLDDYIEVRRRQRRAARGPSTHATGDGRWIRSIERPTRDGGLVGVRVDITELRAQRAAAEQAQRAAEAATQRLHDAIEALPDGFALYDAEDRLVVCNARYRELYRESAPVLELGTRFEDLLRFGLAHGQYPQAAGREEEWLAARLQRHRNPGPPEIQQLPGNRWIRIDERRTRDGGSAGVRTDVTELVRREQELVELNVRLDEARARLEQLSETDALTGIANRRQFDRRLADEWSRHVRHGTPLTLLLVDVDHFKRYNDAYGHQAGDRCLRRIAELLAACARRPSDLVARYGGEEFAILLPHTEADAAATQAMRCIAAVDEAQIPHRDSPVAPHVTLSVGVALARSRRPGAHETLLQAADRALYQAKAAGRHRAEFG
jgi:diguanylate cyclase (GGDEF)-like protein